MHPELVPLQHMDDLEALLDASAGRPIVLFKHSHSCGVSAAICNLEMHGPKETR